MGFFKKPKAPSVPKARRGPSAEQIRGEEEAKIREENLAALREQEGRRQTLRGRLLATEDEDEAEIKRKRLFGE